MKKTLIAVLAIAMFVAAFGAVGSAYAMEDLGKGPGNGGYGNLALGTNASSLISPYMNDAVAYTLGLDATEVADRLAAGETYYDIARLEGYTEEFIPELLASLKETAAAAAAADGVDQQVLDQFQENTCDGTEDCEAVPNLYGGTNAGMQGRRGGR